MSERPWTQEEDILLLQQYGKCGRRWNEYDIPHRSSTSIKHRYYNHLNLVKLAPPMHLEWDNIRTVCKMANPRRTLNIYERLILREAMSFFGAHQDVKIAEIMNLDLDVAIEHIQAFTPQKPVYNLCLSGRLFQGT
jgi:hypothetical protein